MVADSLVEEYLNHIVCTKVPCSHSLYTEIFDAVSRKEEYENACRDEWGNWDFSYNNSFFEGNLFKPWLDQRVARIWCNQEKRKFPGNRKFALCLSHDMDDVVMNSWKRLIRFIHRRLVKDVDVSRKEKLKSLISAASVFVSLVRGEEYKEINDYYHWLVLEKMYGFKSTFFVFPTEVDCYSKYDCSYIYEDEAVYCGKKMSVADMIRSIDNAGWEIGLHGSVMSARNVGMLKKQKQGIERVLGHEIISIRQHYLSYDIGVTPRLQSDAGFLVDSTQGFNRSVGFRAGTAFPYPCFDHKNAEVLPIWEISQQIMDGALFTNNALEYNEEKAIKLSKQMMDEVEAVNGVLCISWHPNNINNEKYLNVYRAILEEGYRRNAWGCSIGELYRFWTNKG